MHRRAAKSADLPKANAVPPLVRVILSQAMRKCARGEITPALFAAQIDRLEREELRPKGLRFLRHKLPGGDTQFLIEEPSGKVYDPLAGAGRD